MNQEAVRAALAAFLDVPVRFVSDCPRITRAMERALLAYQDAETRYQVWLRDPVGEFPEGGA